MQALKAQMRPSCCWRRQGGGAGGASPRALARPAVAPGGLLSWGLTARPLVAARPSQPALQPALQPQQQQQQQQHAGPCRGPSPPAATAPGGGGAPAPFDPLRDLQRELGMQSNRLDPAVRERVEGAIEALGYRVTVGDAAARAGVTLSEADAALKALAYDALGHLEVSKGGEVVYSFDRDFKRKLRSRSWLQRLRPAWQKAQAVGAYLVRVAFGSALIASVLVVWLAIAVLTSSRDGDRRDRGGGYGGGYYGGGGYYSPGLYLDPFDLFLWADPRYASRTRERLDEGREMNFVEGIFSWVFGDGDPNMSYEERRWRALGRHIQRLGGVVSAEEMAPFLDPPRLPSRLPAGPNKYEDEAFVLPALIRFGGEAFVDDNGGLLYRFPQLQVQASELGALSGPQQSRVPLEREWEFSAASPGQQLGALALGALNVVGVLVLSSMLADPISKLALYRQGLGFVLGLLPYLQAYAAAFFGIPLVRALVDARRNAAINDRNDARVEALEVLQSGGDRALEAKLAGARKLGARKVVGRADVVYTTEQAVDEAANRAEEEEFDRRVGGGPRQQQQQRRGLPEGRANRVDDVFGRGAAGAREAERQRLLRQRELEMEEERARRGQFGPRGRRRDDWDDLDRW